MGNRENTPLLNLLLLYHRSSGASLNICSVDCPSEEDYLSTNHINKPKDDKDLNTVLGTLHQIFIYQTMSLIMRE